MSVLGWNNGFSLSELDEKIVSSFVSFYAGTSFSKIAPAFKAFCVEKKVFLTNEKSTFLSKLLELHFESLGPLHEFISDDEIEEIAVTGLNETFFVFKRKKGWVETNYAVNSKEYFIHLVNRLASSSGRRLSLKEPRLDFSCSSFRVHASIWPICVKQIELTMRRISAEPFSLKQLVDFNTLDSLTAALLSLIASCDLTIMLAGNTGSGKTTTLNSLFSFVPRKDRVLVVEDSPEVNLPHSHVVKLTSSKELNASLSSLVKDGLRMRPDRLVFGEVRSREDVNALFDSLLSGQAKSCFFTFHAESSNEAISRLLFHGVSEKELSAIKLVLIQKRITFLKNGKSEEKRVVTDLAEIVGCESRSLFSNSKLDLKKVYASNLFSTCCQSYCVSKREFISLLREREKKIVAGSEDWSEFNEEWRID
ncbi:MAG: ATPase, T2SS/T4P/T4SS family [Candidatus Micrarchaeota archaeon]